MGERGPERSRPNPGDPDAELTRALEHVRDALRDLKFGEVRLSIQDGVIMQVERIERTRLRRERG